MELDRKLKLIEDRSYEMGNMAYKIFKDKGGIENLNGAVRAYRTAMQALRYGIMYNSIKKEKDGSKSLS